MKIAFFSMFIDESIYWFFFVFQASNYTKLLKMDYKLKASSVISFPKI